MSEVQFELHPQLARDSIHLVDWPLSQVRVINDANFHWFILVPRVAVATEIIDLTEQEQQQLWHESAFLSHWIKAEYAADKLNLASIGNKVGQLHIHHIARFTHDPLWPEPVWGKLSSIPLDESAVTQLQQVFQDMSL